MEYIDRLLMILPALLMAGWSSHTCSKNEYTAKESFLYGFRNGIAVAVGIAAIFYLLSFFGIAKSAINELSTGLIVVFIVGFAYGFYCWEQAMRDGR